MNTQNNKPDNTIRTMAETEQKPAEAPKPTAKNEAAIAALAEAEKCLDEGNHDGLSQAIKKAGAALG